MKSYSEYALLVGVDDSGQQCLVRQSLFISSLEIEFTLPTYGISDFKVDKTTLMAKWPKYELESKSLRLLRLIKKSLIIYSNPQLIFWCDASMAH
ncbi:unnamed protein product [Macrosiphum euphorbiae]|nr:unnamed protein product [Macrosiphum euphorbiae]